MECHFRNLNLHYLLSLISHNHLMHRTPHMVSEFYSGIVLEYRKREMYKQIYSKKKEKSREIRAQRRDTVIQEINRWYEVFIAVPAKIQALLEYDAMYIGVVFQKGLNL